MTFTPKPVKPEITFKDLKKLDIRVGTIISVSEVAKSNKLMKLMVEGWREDFNDPNLPVGVIGFCAGGIPQREHDRGIQVVLSSRDGGQGGDPVSN